MNKYYFAVMGEVRKTENFENDGQAFEHRCELERRTRENWKVYNDRGGLVYGVAIMNGGR